MSRDKIYFVKDVEFGKRLKYYVIIDSDNYDHIALLLDKFKKDELFPKTIKEVAKGE